MFHYIFKSVTYVLSHFERICLILIFSNKLKFLIIDNIFEINRSLYLNQFPAFGYVTQMNINWNHIFKSRIQFS